MDLIEGFARGYSNLQEGLRADRESRNTDWGAVSNALRDQLGGQQRRTPTTAERQHNNALKRTNEVCQRLQAAKTAEDQQAAIRRFRADTTRDMQELARSSGGKLVTSGAWPQLPQIAPVCRSKGFVVGGPRT